MKRAISSSPKPRLFATVGVLPLRLLPPAPSKECEHLSDYRPESQAEQDRASNVVVRQDGREPLQP